MSRRASVSIERVDDEPEAPITLPAAHPVGNFSAGDETASQSPIGGGRAAVPDSVQSALQPLQSGVSLDLADDSR
jgi:hypothetical protein